MNRIIFFGNERLATGLPESQALVLDGLISAGYTISAVFTRADKHPSAVEAIARRNNIPVFTPASKAELIEQSRDIEADIGVLVAFGIIVPEALINTFEHGIINLHPSKLPFYRGSTPIEQAILDGIDHTAVSIMALAQEMDAGPVYVQRVVDVPALISKSELVETLHTAGAELLLESLPKILSAQLKGVPQDESNATFCPQLSKTDGIMDWQKPAERLAREVRAYAGWPGSRTTISGKDVIVTRASVVESDYSAPGTLVMEAGDNTFLQVHELKPVGKKTMSAADFLRGIRA